MNSKKQPIEWFESWFDSPFYHKLYKNRDFAEAEFFIKNLVLYLNLKPKQKMLDLACGKGRHAFFLSKFKLDVLGLDLSKSNIEEAQKLSTKYLHFDVHDMREVYPNKKFDVVFNLFTSFGYFDDEKDNLKVLRAINSMLNPKGKLVIDFMNTKKAISDLVESEEKVVEESVFDIQRSYDGKHILKKISFTTKDDKNYKFTEKVRDLRQKDFENLLETAEFKILNVFGDYNLKEFDIHNSPRLILIAEKK